MVGLCRQRVQKRVHDIHIRLTDSEKEMTEEYRAHLDEQLGTERSLSESFRSLAVRGYRAFKAEQKRKRRVG